MQGMGLIVPELAGRVGHVEDALRHDEAEGSRGTRLDHASEVRVVVLDADNLQTRGGRSESLEQGGVHGHG